jgi:hypothetical protein
MDHLKLSYVYDKIPWNTVLLLETDVKYSLLHLQETLKPCC